MEMRKWGVHLVIRIYGKHKIFVEINKMIAMLICYSVSYIFSIKYMCVNHTGLVTGILKLKFYNIYFTIASNFSTSQTSINKMVSNLKET